MDLNHVFFSTDNFGYKTCVLLSNRRRGAPFMVHCIASYARFRRRADSVRIYKVSGPLLDKWFISF